MFAHELRPPKGAKHARKRVGRGNASGHGTYSGRGLKGQKARAGRTPRLGFEGGQTRLIKRLPRRRGFTNIFRKEYVIVHVKDLNRFESGSVVDLAALMAAGLVKKAMNGVKLLADGEVDRPLSVKVDKASRAAAAKVTAAGGTLEVSSPC
jgi:large subunit ribosomal protein L15